MRALAWLIEFVTLGAYRLIPGNPQAIAFTTPPDDEGRWIKAELTTEGVIVDQYDEDGELTDTFARMYDEFFD